MTDTAGKTRPYLIWEHNERAEFHSLSELEQLIDQLTTKAVEENTPLGIQVCLNADTCLLITVGCEESYMAFYSSSGHPLVTVCCGPWIDDDLLEIDFMGEPTEIKKQHCVPITDAREALHRYFFTGERPDNISWNH